MLLIEKPTLSDLRSSLLPILYMTVLSGGIATRIQMIFKKDTGPSLGSLLMSFESVFAALGGWLILHQTMTLREIFGAVLLFIAILIAEKN